MVIPESEEHIFVPDTARAASSDAAKDIVIVFYEDSILTNDACVDQRGELAVEDLPVAYLAVFLVRIGHAHPLFEANQTSVVR